jgi:O-succinylbenzoate synthase
VNSAKDCLFSSRNDSFKQMDRRFSFHPYQRTFVNPLRTARGAWTVRKGFIVRAEHEAGVGYGEIAPIPEFGTETVRQAEDFLWSLVAEPELATDAAALAKVPCCAFGLSAALMKEAVAPRRSYDVAALLPAGARALSVLKSKCARGYDTFKWKIGVEPVEVEQAIFEKMVPQLPTGARLRLDANGGLSVSEMETWLWILQRYGEQVEYFEQPLAVGQERVMADYAESFGVALALDESLNGVGGERWFSQWQGPLVVKPALMGDIDLLIQLLQPVATRVVLSSVFETAIGLESALLLADRLPQMNRAVGFDTLDAFSDPLSFFKPTAVLGAAERAKMSPEVIWESDAD